MLCGLVQLLLLRAGSTLEMGRRKLCRLIIYQMYYFTATAAAPEEDVLNKSRSQIISLASLSLSRMDIWLLDYRSNIIRLKLRTSLSRNI